MAPSLHRLSDLPCDVLCKILSQLSTKESVSTSVLSRRWKDLWSQVPVLDLGFNDFNSTFNLMGFIDCFLEPNLPLDSFKLVYDVDTEHCHESFVLTIDEVVERGVSHLTIENMVSVDDDMVRMPLSLYSCSTLVDLTLYTVVFDRPPRSKLVSLPRVKTMYLEGVKFDGRAILGKLISSCRVLEDLTVITYEQDYLEVVCVRSQSLKSFRLESQRNPEEERDPNVVIDAPRLEYLSVSDYRPERFVIRNVGPYAKVNVDVMFDDIDLDDPDPLEVKKIRKFLFGISKFHEVAISAGTLEVIHGYSQVGKLPKFLNLTRLDASLVGSSWEHLPAFLGCCKNLHSLILELDHIPKREEIELSPVPQCVLSSLHSLQLKARQRVGQMMLVSYFRNNCKALRTILVGWL